MTDRAEDLEVIEAVLAGEIERYGELVNRHRLAVLRMAYSWVRNEEDAKELSQNAFVKAYRHLRRFRAQARFSTWLYRIVANECKNFLRWAGRQPRKVPLVGEQDGEGPALFEVSDSSQSPREQVADRELALWLTRAIERLPEKQREAFTLHHLNGLPLAEVSQVMGCRVGTVKVHLFRATESLRVSVEPYLAMERPR